VKKPSWLRWSHKDKPADTPPQDTIRRRTDQMIRQQDIQKHQQDEAQKDRRGESGKGKGVR